MSKVILIIEDNKLMRLIIFKLLKSTNFRLISAPDGLCGLQLAKTLQPDLILCDINMPKLNGYGVLKKLREDLNTANIPFIFLTSNADPDSRCRAMKLGANDYLTKPVNRTELLEAIAKQFQELHSA